MLNRKWMTAFAASLLICGFTASVDAAGNGNFSVQADELEYNLKTGEAVAKGNVVIVQDDAKLTSEAANYNSKTKTGSIKGNVVANRVGEQVSCNELVIKNENEYSALGNVLLVKDGRRLSAPQVDYSRSKEYAETVGTWAQLIDSDGSSLEAVKLTYDAKQGIVTASGGVNINSTSRNLTAYADKAIYSTKQDGFVELIGNAKANQDGNTIKGDKLRLTNTNSVAVADGNVNIIYVPKQDPAKKEADKSKQLAMAEPAIVNKEHQVKA